MSIPLIATRNTAELNDAISPGHGGRPMLGSSGVDANVHANGGATAEQAPYLLTVQSTGSVDGYGLAARIAAKSGINEYTIRMVVNATYEVIEKFVTTYGAVKLYTPLGVIETMVANSLEFATDQLDEEKNYAYLNCTPASEIQRSTKGIAFFNATEKTLPFDVDAVRNFATGGDEPFRCGDYVSVRGSNFASGLVVTFVDQSTSGVTTADDVTILGEATLKVKVPVTLNPEHKQKLYVKQTIEGEELNLPSNKEFSVLPSPLPDHVIGLVKHGSRADDSIAFDEGQTAVVVNVTHNNGATHLLRAQPPKLDINIDFMDGDRHKTGTLEELYDITVTENTISFKMTDNTTELIDGDFWNRDVTLRLYWADGTVSEKTLHFLQM